MEEMQNSDGSYGGYRERDAQEFWRAGGNAGPPGSNQPSYLGGFTLCFNVNGASASGGGLISWQNTKGYDLLVTAHQLDVTTVATSAATVSAGQSATSTGVSHTMISGQDVHSATGTFNGGAISVKVPNGTWLTASQASGSASGLIATATFNCQQAPQPGAA